MIQIAVLFCCVIIALSSEFAEDRQKEFNKIQKYETIRPVFDDTNLRLEFDAFNEHWTIQLEVNDDISPVVAHLTDENGESVPYEQDPEHYECHYRGMILNAVSSFVALSFCPGAGVIGTLWLRGQTLFIKPINYYLDPLNEALTIADHHIIFRKDDVYDSDMSKHVWATTDWDASFHSLDSIPKPIIPHLYFNPMNQTATSTRRRLATTRTIELYLLMDQSLYASKGGYSATISMAQRIANTASGFYQKTSWPSPVGSIKFKLVHVEVNTYRSFCSRCNSKQTWNNAMRKHMKDQHSRAQFDYAFGIFYKNTKVGGGASIQGKMCTSLNSIGVALGTSEEYRLARLLAHESGHSLGLSHDTKQNCCPPKYQTTGRQYKGGCCKGPASLCVSWIMDTSTNGDDWSPCSKAEMKKIYSGTHSLRPNLNCLRQTSTRYSENRGKDGNSAPFVDDSPCSQNYADKMCFYDPDDEEFVLEIEDEECVNGEKVYSFVYNETDHYLYAMTSGEGWVIAEDMSDMEQSFVCFSKDLYGCVAGNWSIPTAEDGDMLGFEVDENVMIKRCDVEEDTAELARSETTAIVIVLVVTAIIIGVAIAVFIYHRNRNRGKHSFNQKIGEKVKDEDEDEEEIEEGDAEEVEIVLPTTTTTH
eukprot:218414_1